MENHFFLLLTGIQTRPYFCGSRLSPGIESLDDFNKLILNYFCASNHLVEHHRALILLLLKFRFFNAECPVLQMFGFLHFNLSCGFYVFTFVQFAILFYFSFFVACAFLFIGFLNFYGNFLFLFIHYSSVPLDLDLVVQFSVFYGRIKPKVEVFYIFYGRIKPE